MQKQRAKISAEYSSLKIIGFSLLTLSGTLLSKGMTAVYTHLAS